MSSRSSLSDALRKAIKQSGRSLYRLSQEALIAYPVLWRFQNGKGDLRLKTADRITDLLGLRLTKADKRERAKQ